MLLTDLALLQNCPISHAELSLFKVSLDLKMTEENEKDFLSSQINIEK